jgi:hypothetical protein
MRGRPRLLPSVPAALSIALFREPVCTLDQCFPRGPARRTQLCLMPSGIDFESSSVAVPCSVAHTARATRV